MKTNHNSKTKKHIGLLVLFCVLSVCCISQSDILPKQRIGISIGSQLSGNGHGTLYEGAINLSNYENILSIGALVQKRKNEICGMSLAYTRPIFVERPAYCFEEGVGRDVQLFFYGKVQYIHQASLSFRAESLEDRYYTETNDENIDFKNYKMSTVEIMAGFGLNIRICKRFIWANSFGFGFYNHINHKMGMYCDKAGPEIILGTALRLARFDK